jgi:hypothetical protein
MIAIGGPFDGKNYSDGIPKETLTILDPYIVDGEVHLARYRRLEDSWVYIEVDPMPGDLYEIATIKDVTEVDNG